METKINLLEKEIYGTGEVGNFKYCQIRQSVSAYLYEIHSGNGLIGFEVFKRKNVPICIDFEKREYSTTEFKEVYPKSNDFGVWAWTYSTLPSALTKFEEL